MKATRHNGRSGKHGSYNPKHNDRQFDISHSEHIDGELALQNVYWDCYGGRRTSAETPENDESFEEVELRFYHDNYQDFVNGQNYRNECNGHSERNRSVEEIYRNKKTCPEESILQLGNIDGSASAETLMNVAETFFEQFNERFGEHVHILDWALHVDEKTPHIHERHVFDALNAHGELAPQQDKALEALGIELPDPKKPKSKSNNRKMVFDAICRDMFLSICEEYGLSVDREPTYGGKKYLEKQDFIIQNQQVRLANIADQVADKEKDLEKTNVEFAAIDTIMNSIASSIYDSTCSVVAEVVTRDVLKRSIDSAKAAKDEEERTSFYSSYEKQAMGKLLKRFINRVEQTIDDVVYRVKCKFSQDDNRSKNIQLVQQKMWRNLDRLAESGPHDYEICYGNELNYSDMGKVGSKTQEIAQQVVRRRRGR